MGIFGKLAFWKKNDEMEDIGKDLGLDKDFGGAGTGMSPDLGLGMEQDLRHQGFQPPQPEFQQQSFQPAFPQPSSPGQDFINSKSLEVISSKLDALRASVESINQRLANLESMARNEIEESRRKRYY